MKKWIKDWTHWMFNYCSIYLEGLKAFDIIQCFQTSVWHMWNECQSNHYESKRNTSKMKCPNFPAELRTNKQHFSNLETWVWTEEMDNQLLWSRLVTRGRKRREHLMTRMVCFWPGNKNSEGTRKKRKQRGTISSSNAHVG